MLHLFLMLPKRLYCYKQMREELRELRDGSCKAVLGKCVVSMETHRTLIAVLR